MKSMVFVAAALAAVGDALPDMGSLGRFRNAVSGQIVKRGKQLPIQTPQLKKGTSQGCYSSAGNMTKQADLEWNTIDLCCDSVCRPKGFAAGASMGGIECWCGDEYPALDTLVDDSKCSVTCPGYGDHNCGGIEIWSVYNTGLTLAVKHEANTTNPTTSSTAVSSSKTPTATQAPIESTVVVTPTSTGETDSDGGGPNVGGIVAGVVVGVVVIAALIGGGYLYMRRKRIKEIEEEHRRNAAVNAFIGKPPGSSGGTSMTDSRLDPVLANRRMSDGSIADNQDYSRRILRVTNA